MALTRNFLKSLNLTDEQVGAIIEVHTEVTDALKAQRDGYKEKADKFDNTKKELDELKAKGGDTWQEKYEKEHSDFEAYKNTVKEEKALNAKKTAFKSILEEAKIDDKKHEAITRLYDFSKFELDNDGKVKDRENILKAVAEENSAFVIQSNTKGANTSTPPAQGGGKMSKEDISKITDPEARIKAIAQNINLYKNE